MSVVAYYAGWDFAKVGTMTFTVTDGGGAHAATAFSAGTYAHPSVSSVVTTHTQFAATLKTTLDALAGTQVYTVTFSATTGFYTISVDTGTFAIAFADAFSRNMLGFSGNIAATASATSTEIAKYGIIASVGARTSISNVYQMPGRTKVAVADDGSVYHSTPTTTPRLLDWKQVFETKAKTFAEFAAAPNNTDWRTLFSHLATGEHLACYDSNYSKTYIGKVREDGAAFAINDTIEPATGDINYDAYWNVAIKLHYIGEL